MLSIIHEQGYHWSFPYSCLQTSLSCQMNVMVFADDIIICAYSNIEIFSSSYLANAQFGKKDVYPCLFLFYIHLELILCPVCIRPVICHTQYQTLALECLTSFMSLQSVCY